MRVLGKFTNMLEYLEKYMVLDKYRLLGLGCVAVTGFTFNLSFKSFPLGIILCFVYFSVVTFFIARIFFNKEPRANQVFFGFPFSISLLSILGAITYFVFDFSDIPTIFSLLAFLIMLFLLLIWKGNNNSDYNRKNVKPENLSKKHIGHLHSFLFAFCFILIIFSYIILYQSRTVESLRSPWDVIPLSFFILFFLISCLLIYLIRYKQTRITIGVLLILLSMVTFLISAIYLIVLKYPYPERGVATIVAEERKFLEFGKFIWWSGDVEKISATFFHKDLVYITGYTTISIFSKFLSIDPYFTNLLIPVLFAVFLPASTYLLVEQFKPNAKKLALFACVAFLFSQHNVFTLVPPTNWEVFGIIFLQLSIYFWVNFIKEKESLLTAFCVATVFTLMTLLSHAYVGLYSLIVALVCIYLHYFPPFGRVQFQIKKSYEKTMINLKGPFVRNKKKLFGFIILIFVVSFSIIPVYLIGNLFIFNSSEAARPNLEIDLGSTSKIIFPEIWDDTDLPFLERSLQFSINNFSYLLYFLILLGLILSLNSHPDYTIVIITLILFSFSSMILQTSLFSSMGWTREYYRFFYYMNFVSFPIVGFALNKLFTITHRINTLLGVFFVILLATSLTSSMYAGFPRKDSMGPYGDNPKYISEYDVAAINFIKNEEQLEYPISFFIFGDSYTCSAALLEIGFPKLENGIKRFSPYSSWLLPEIWSDMLKRPSLGYFEDVMNQTGASNIYLILSYRLAMDSIEDFNKTISSYSTLLGNPIFEISGKIYVFKYQQYRESDFVTVIVDEKQTDFWSLNQIGVGEKDLFVGLEPEERFGSDSLNLIIMEGNSSYFHLYHRYPNTQNWSSQDLFVLSMFGNNSKNTFNIILRAPSVEDYFVYTLVDDFKGWRNIVVPLTGFTKYGNASWEEIKEILLIFGNNWQLGNQIRLNRFRLDIRDIS